MSHYQFLLGELSEALLSLSVALQKLSREASETLPIVEGVDFSSRPKTTVPETFARITSMPEQLSRLDANGVRAMSLEELTATSSHTNEGIAITELDK